MRVIAGIYKGHQLVSFSADHIRPTTDRVKEALFNILQLEIEDTTRVLDCFSGTGNLGIEALSRGASFVTFVDNHSKSIQILKKNLTKLKILPSQYEIVKSDIFDFIQKNDFSNFHLIFIDPPFTKKMANSVMLEFSKNTSLPQGIFLSIESAASEVIQDSYPHLTLYKRREFGDKILSIFQKT